MMCTVLRHRHPALTRAELTCDGGRRTVGSQVATYSLKLTLKQHSATECLQHNVLGSGTLCFAKGVESFAPAAKVLWEE